MIIGHHFAPDAQRARALNARMHDELAQSLRYVVEESRGAVRFDEGAMSTLLSGLRTGANYPPSAFAGYYDIVDAILQDRLDAAQDLFAELARSRPWRAGLQVKVLGSPELGANSDRYAKMMNSDPSVGFAVPDPEVAAAFRARLTEGMDLLARALPELSAEIGAIVREIVISGGDASKMMQFDGGSHYRLWGALFLNAEFHPTPLSVVEVLAHESAHSLLFGFCTHEPLVENPDDELFTSPLRADARPMDGIYHATFVSARMHWAMSQMLRTGLLDKVETESARAAAEADADNFAAGYSVVAEHGRLTHLGQGLMAGAKRYMDSQG
jgi:HEXXH motif-containing protein